jgi:hypothetical protein
MMKCLLSALTLLLATMAIANPVPEPDTEADLDTVETTDIGTVMDLTADADKAQCLEYMKPCGTGLGECCSQYKCMHWRIGPREARCRDPPK